MICLLLHAQMSLAIWFVADVVSDTTCKAAYTQLIWYLSSLLRLPCCILLAEHRMHPKFDIMRNCNMLSFVQALVVHKLEHLTSKSACSAAVESSQNDISIEVSIFTANMRYVTQRQVSMLRHMIDDAQRSTPQGDRPKKWVLLLHSAPGGGMHDSYPTMFLYGWDFWYLDSCTGGVSQHEMLNMQSWVTSATAALRGHAIAADQLQGVYNAKMLLCSNHISTCMCI